MWTLIIFSSGLFSQQVWGQSTGSKQHILPPIEIEFGETVSEGDKHELENFKSTVKNFVERTLSHPLFHRHAEALSKRPVIIRIQNGLTGGLFDDGVSELSGKCGEYRFSRKLSVNIGVARLFDRTWSNLLAHELFHFVHYIVNPDEPRWLREGLALWFEYHVTRNPPGSYLMAALQDIQTPLMSDYEACEINPEQYGHNFFFAHFIAKNCGGEETIARIMSPSVVKGRKKLEGVLAGLTGVPPVCKDFSKLVLTMELARAQNQIVFAGPPSYLSGEVPKEMFWIWPSSSIWRAGLPKIRSHQELELFEPILLKEGESVPVSQPNFEVFWLEQSSPYAIIKSPSRPPEGKYRQFIIRTH